MNILDRRFEYTSSDSTDISKRFRSLGHTPRSEDEAKERYESALRCMKRMAEYFENVTPLRRRT